MSTSVIESSPVVPAYIPRMRRRAVPIVAAVMVLEIAAVAAVFGVETMRLDGASKETVALLGMRGGPGNAYSFFAIDAPAIERPETAPATASELNDEETVFGVEVGGKFRAYRALALSTPDTHVINDLIDGVPISVTFCNESRCVRVFTDESSRTPLKISAAGKVMTAATEMVLNVNGGTYYQSSLEPANLQTSPETPVPQRSFPAFPFRNYAVETVTWKVWREEHPDTDVFEGTASAPVRQFSGAGIDPVF